jgi:hypothetical protein
MTARELAKKIRKELDRQARYRRDHGSVSVEKVKAVEGEVRSLIEEIKADFPEISFTDEGGRRHHLSDGRNQYILVDYEKPRKSRYRSGRGTAPGGLPSGSISTKTKSGPGQAPRAEPR